MRQSSGQAALHATGSPMRGEVMASCPAFEQMIGQTTTPILLTGRNAGGEKASARPTLVTLAGDISA
jgi:hypothetical protein